MKIAAVVTVVALACGSAFAAQTSTERDTATSRNRSAAVSTDKQAKASNGGLIEKTKSGLRRMGDKIRSTGDRISKKTTGRTASVRNDEQGTETRAMGSSSRSSSDQARQARMDDAYGNWKSKQK